MRVAPRVVHILRRCAVVSIWKNKKEQTQNQNKQNKGQKNKTKCGAWLLWQALAPNGFSPKFVAASRGFSPKWLQRPQMASDQNGFSPPNGKSSKWLQPQMASAANGVSPKGLKPQRASAPKDFSPKWRQPQMAMHMSARDHLSHRRPTV